MGVDRMLAQIIEVPVWLLVCLVSFVLAFAVNELKNPEKRK